MNVMRDFLSAENGRLSSKRLVGLIAWIVILTEYIHAGISTTMMPEGYDIILYSASALIGVDSVVKPFKKEHHESIND